MVLGAVSTEKFTAFTTLFNPDEGKIGVVVTFLAVLELIKESLLEIVQTEPYGPIYVRAPQHVDEPTVVESTIDEHSAVEEYS